jgi:glycosyltransferase involved in cell wall biosynthesis
MRVWRRPPPVRTDVVYLSTEGLPPTVLDSQVGDHLIHMRDRGFRIHWLALIGLRDYRREYREQRRRFRALRQRLDGAIELLPFPYPGSALALPLLARRLRRRMAGGKPVVIHARGHDACRLGLGVRRANPAARVIFDVRGEAEAELRYHANGTPARTLQHAIAAARLVERHATTEADLWFCVSERLRDHLRRVYPELAEDKMFVVPCAASARKFHFDPNVRAATRERLGLAPDVPVLIYVGQLIRYEMPNATVALTVAAQRVWPNLHLIVATPHTEEANRLLAGALPPSRYTVVRAAHHEINAYLNAADIGLLIREPHLLNEVACPTKFGEYAATGLPVILTERIGDCSAYVRHEYEGIVLDAPDDTATLLARLPFLAPRDFAARRRRAALGQTRFSREAHDHTYVEAYTRLLAQ